MLVEEYLVEVLARVQMRKRLRLNLSTEAVKDVTMALHTSGRFTTLSMVVMAYHRSTIRVVWETTTFL